VSVGGSAVKVGTVGVGTGDSNGDRVPETG